MLVGVGKGNVERFKTHQRTLRGGFETREAASRDLERFAASQGKPTSTYMLVEND